MAATSEFWENPVASEWKNTLNSYQEVLSAKCSKKTKATAGKELQELDEWYQNSLPEIITGRDKKHINSDELVKLMKWKLARGKFRPRLVQLAGSNSDEDVINITTKAFSQLDNGHLETAIKSLSTMKGIGPATASAILAAGDPEQAAFMADEPTVAILAGQNLKYNIQEYMAYMDGIKSIKAKLVKQDSKTDWSAHKVELCIWTHYLADKLGIDICEKNSSAKRKSNGTDDTHNKKKKKK